MSMVKIFAFFGIESRLKAGNIFQRSHDFFTEIVFSGLETI